MNKSRLNQTNKIAQKNEREREREIWLRNYDHKMEKERKKRRNI